MRKLTFAMNLSLDGYIAAPGDDLGWSVPSDELFQWWSDRVGATGLALYGRRLWEAMSSHWPTAGKQPGATPAAIEYAGRWRDMPKVVFSSTISSVDWNTRLVTGDAVTEITRLKAGDGGPMDIGGATLAAAAMRAGLIDECRRFHRSWCARLGTARQIARTRKHALGWCGLKRSSEAQSQPMRCSSIAKSSR
jgi:dihydrofolate reductase